MDSISYAPDREPSTAPSDRIPCQITIVQWQPNGVVNPDIFACGTTIGFHVQPDSTVLAIWQDASTPTPNEFEVGLILQANGSLESGPANPPVLDNSRVDMILSPVPGTKQWNGLLIPDPKPVTGARGTFVAEADPDPQLPPMG